MSLDQKEVAGMDVWDKLRQKMGRVAAAPPQDQSWYQDRRAPKPGEPIPGPVQRPRVKPRTAPPIPSDGGKPDWWQDKRMPKQWQDQTSQGPGPDGQDNTSSYNSSRADQDRLMRGAYEAGRNGDAGAASSFPAGSPFEQAYRQGLRDRQRGR